MHFSNGPKVLSFVSPHILVPKQTVNFVARFWVLTSPCTSALSAWVTKFGDAHLVSPQRLTLSTYWVLLFLQLKGVWMLRTWRRGWLCWWCPPLIPSLWRQRQARRTLSFQANLAHRVSSRSAKASQRKPVSKPKQQKWWTSIFYVSLEGCGEAAKSHTV